jgi:hypothetical protein
MIADTVTIIVLQVTPVHRMAHVTRHVGMLLQQTPATTKSHFTATQTETR